MLNLWLFAPLAPSEDYPYSVFDLTLDWRRYDLPVPIYVGEALDTAITSPDLDFLRLDRYCNVERIDLLRDDPARLDRESAGVPAYAEVESEFDLLGRGGEPDRGYATRRVIVSAKVAARLLALLHEDHFFEERVGEHLLRRAAFLRESGGFELLSATYYFDDVDRRQVRRSVPERRPEEVAEQRGRKLRFRDVVRSS